MKELMIRQVGSLDLPELAPYRTLRRPEEHFRQRIFVAEGEKVVRRMLDSGLDLLSLLLTEVWLERLAAGGHLQGRESVPIFVAEQSLLREIVGFNIHQGIMGVGRVPEEPSLRNVPTGHLLVALDGLRMSENTGVIVRSCAAFGVDAVLAGENSCSPYLRRAVRNSMGAVFKMPVIHVDSLVRELAGLQSRSRTRIITADPHGAVPIHEVDLNGNVCFVLGNENEGVSAPVAALADARVFIPMHNDTDSLNVASAGAVFLYEADRQRRMPR